MTRNANAVALAREVAERLFDQLGGDGGKPRAREVIDVADLVEAYAPVIKRFIDDANEVSVHVSVVQAHLVEIQRVAANTQRVTIEDLGRPEQNWPLLWHRCRGKLRPYPAVVCSSCAPGEAVDFDPVERLNEVEQPSRFLYLLTRDERVTYDENRAIVVCAENEDRARAYAAHVAADEKDTPWTDTARSRCGLLGIAHRDTPLGALCIDSKGG